MTELKVLLEQQEIVKSSHECAGLQGFEVRCPGCCSQSSDASRGIDDAAIWGGDWVAEGSFVRSQYCPILWLCHGCSPPNAGDLQNPLQCLPGRYELAVSSTWPACLCQNSVFILFSLYLHIWDITGMKIWTSPNCLSLSLSGKTQGKYSPLGWWFVTSILHSSSWSTPHCGGVMPHNLLSSKFTLSTEWGSIASALCLSHEFKVCSAANPEYIAIPGIKFLKAVSV